MKVSYSFWRTAEGIVFLAKLGDETVSQKMVITERATEDEVARAKSIFANAAVFAITWLEVFGRPFNLAKDGDVSLAPIMVEKLRAHEASIAPMVAGLGHVGDSFGVGEKMEVPT